MSIQNFYSTLNVLSSQARQISASIEAISDETQKLFQGEETPVQISEDLVDVKEYHRATLNKIHYLAIDLIQKNFERIVTSDEETISKRLALNDLLDFAIPKFDGHPLSQHAQKALHLLQENIKQFRQSLYDKSFNEPAYVVDPLKILNPTIFFMHIFPLLSKDEQSSCALVSKTWNDFTNYKYAKKIEDYALESGKSNWFKERVRNKFSNTSFISYKFKERELVKWAENFHHITQRMQSAWWTYQHISLEHVSKNSNKIARVFEMIDYFNTHPEETNNILALYNWQYPTLNIEVLSEDLLVFPKLSRINNTTSLTYISPKLSKLNVTHLNICGKIPFPKNLLSAWKNLDFLYLWDFTSIPLEELQELKKLENLALFRCNISSFPREILELAQLKQLKFDPPLKQVPKEIFQRLPHLDEESKAAILAKSELV